MTTPYAKKKQKWRRKARAKLRLILDDQNGMCHWCMAPLVILAGVLLFGTKGMLQRGFLERLGQGLYRVPKKMPYQPETSP